VLPLSFLSAAFLPLSRVPTWMRWAARLNLVNWAVDVGRQSLAGGTDWALILMRMGLLLALAVACAWFATNSFRAYRRSM
jgi:ABC-type multidrug transport system permease subunit